jgi:hypothetical protein
LLRIRRRISEHPQEQRWQDANSLHVGLASQLSKPVRFVEQYYDAMLLGNRGEW